MNEASMLLGVAAIVGGFIRGFAGFGGPMTIIPILGLFYPPALSIWIMAVVDLAANIYLVPTAWRHATVRVYLPLILGSGLTLALGVYALVLVDPVTMRRVICVSIILACGLLMSGWLFRGRLGTTSWLAVGAASGLVLGATLIAVVTSLFLNAASRDAQENRANFIVWGCVTGAAMVALLSGQQDSAGEHLPIIALLSAIYFVGCIVGALAQQRVTGLLVRKLTLALIIFIAGAGLAASYNVFE